MTQPELSPLDFTLAAAQLLGAEPGVSIVGIDTLELYLDWQGREVQAQLANFYDLYRANPSSLSVVLDSLREALADLPPDRSQTDPKELLTRLMPMLKPLSLLNELRQQSIPLLAYRPLVGDLMITYVIDEGEHVAYVNENHLAAWQVTEAVLYQHALRNLAQRDNPLQLVGGGARSLLISATSDGYAATRLLLPDLFRTFQQNVRGRIVIGVPNRDFLIAFSDDDPVTFERIAAQIAEDAVSKPYALTDQLFTLRNGELAVYE